LHKPNVFFDRVIVINIETNLIAIEGERFIDVCDRQDDKL